MKHNKETWWQFIKKSNQFYKFKGSILLPILWEVKFSRFLPKESPLESLVKNLSYHICLIGPDEFVLYKLASEPEWMCKTRFVYHTDLTSIQSFQEEWYRFLFCFRSGCLSGIKHLSRRNYSWLQVFYWLHVLHLQICKIRKERMLVFTKPNYHPRPLSAF